VSDIAVSKNGLRVLKVFFGLLVVFLYAPLLVLFVFSFNDDTTIRFPLQGFTTQWYRDFLANPELTGSLRTSAIIAAIASTVGVLLGILASLVLVRRRFFGKSGVTAFLLSPLVIPYVVFGIALLILFKTVDVFLDQWIGVTIGLSIWTVAIGHVVIFLPYAILVLAPRIERIDERLEEAARDLGATGLRTFRSITLPLIVPAVLSSFLISFTFSFDEFAVANFVVGDQVTFPIYLYSQLRFPTLLPQAIAVAVVVFVASLVIVMVAEVGRRFLERKLDVEGEGSTLVPGAA
jgi:spermidine/putrescine transport system permease protein